MMKSACHYWEEKKMIPVFRAPYPDEHVLGWMIELANLNRMSIEKFLKWFMPSFKWEHSADTVANMFNIKYVNPLKIMRQNTFHGGMKLQKNCELTQGILLSPALLL